jgi:hypothetical protein
VSVESALPCDHRPFIPTSDPVSVTITKGEAIDYDEHGRTVPGQGGSQGSSQPDTGEAIVTQAKKALSGAARTASEVAGEAIEQGRRYARQAAERFPQATRYSREGMERARSYAAEAPPPHSHSGVCAWLCPGLGHSQPLTP